MDSTESDATDKPFFEDMQDFVVWQARRLINNNLYTKSLLSSLPVPFASNRRKYQSGQRAAGPCLGRFPGPDSGRRSAEGGQYPCPSVL
jgi:hypothetical protein